MLMTSSMFYTIAVYNSDCDGGEAIKTGRSQDE